MTENKPKRLQRLRRNPRRYATFQNSRYEQHVLTQCNGKQETPKAKTNEPAEAAESPDDMFTTGWLSRLHRPGGNEQVYPERMQEHLDATGGKVFTRFPPEPNGFLHVRERGE